MNITSDITKEFDMVALTRFGRRLSSSGRRGIQFLEPLTVMDDETAAPTLSSTQPIRAFEDPRPTSNRNYETWKSHEPPSTEHVMTTLIAFNILLSIGCLCQMMGQGGGGGGRGRLGRVPDPPSWDPANERTHSFRDYTQELMIWGVLAVDMDPAQQAAAIINRLQGEARRLGHSMSIDDITRGGQINGIQLDPVSYLLTTLAAHFAPLGEESRLQAMTELMSFARRPGESTDAMIARFRTLRWRAAAGGAGINMTWEGYTWLLLKACGISAQQLMSLLQPTNGRFPTNEQDFENMLMMMRRMGHILENSAHNLAHQLRTPPASVFPTWGGGGTYQQQPPGLAFPAALANAAPDPWATADPWGGGGVAAQHPPAAAYPGIPTAHPWNTDAWTAPQAHAYPALAVDTGDGTDTDTASSIEDQTPADPAIDSLPLAQQDEHYFWNYQKGKSQWRRHMKKPTRKVRRFVKTKGKGKGKGKHRFSFLSTMGDDEYDSIFFGGKGKSKGKRRSTGKAGGRSKNPIGSDGNIMLCGICGADDHFRAQCPRSPTTMFAAGGGCGGAGHTHNLAAPARSVDLEVGGPLGDLLSAPAPATNSVAGMYSAMPVDEGIVWQNPDMPWGTVPNFTSVAQPTVRSNITDMQVPWGAANFINNMYAGEDAQVFADPARPAPVFGDLTNISSLMQNRNQLVNAASDLGDGLIHHHPAPQPRDPPEDIMAQFPGLQAFSGRDRLRQTMLQRSTQVDEEAQENVNVHHEPGFLRFTRPPGVNPHASMPVPLAHLHGLDQAVHSRTIDTFHRIQANHAPNIIEARDQRRQAAARALHNMMASGRVQTAAPPQQQADAAVATPATAAEPQCTICFESYHADELVTLLQCTHHFHQPCLDNWTAIRLRERHDMDCPMCRQEAIVAQIQRAAEIHMPTFHLEGRMTFDRVFGTPSEGSLTITRQPLTIPYLPGTL